MEATSLLNLNPTTKQEAESFAYKLTLAVQEGQVNPLEVHVKLNAMKSAIETAQKNVREFVMKEVDKYPEKTIDAYTAKIEKTEVGVKYDFLSCNDIVWMQLMEELNELQAKVKERETFLKTLKAPMNVVANDGECYTINPPVKSSQSFIKVTLK